MVRNGLKFVVLFVVAAFLHAATVQVRDNQLVPEYWIDVWEGVFFLSLIGAGAWIVRRIEKPLLARRLFFAMLAMAILRQTLEVTHDIPSLDGVPILGLLSPINGPLRHFLGGTTALAIIAMGCSALLEFERSHTRLAVSEERLEKSQHIAHIGSWTWDVVAGSLWWSDETYRIFGLDPERTSLSYAVFQGAVHPEDWAIVERAVESALSGSAGFDVEHRIVLPDGTVRTVRGWAEATKDEFGKPVRMTGVVQDISDRKAANQALEDREHRYRSLFESTAVALWECDGSAIKRRLDAMEPGQRDELIRYFLEHRETAAEFRGMLEIVDVNDAALRLFGTRSREEFIHGEAALVLDRRFEVFLQALSLGVEGATHFQTEYKSRTFDGRIITINAHINMMPGHETTWSRVLISSFDVTEQRAVEEALRKSEERLKLVLAGTRIEPWDWDIQTGELHLGPVWGESLGLCTGETPYTAASFSARIHPDDIANVNSSRTQHFEYNTPFYEAEYRLADLKGNWLWVLERGKAIERNEEGGAVLVAGLYMDISDRKRREAEQSAFDQNVRHTQKLESLGVLAGGIAHDFNNLLSAIMGNADLALADLDGESPARRSVEEIGKAAQHAAELCKQMLAYSGRGHILVRSVNLNALVEEISHLLQAAMSKNVSLRIDLGKDLPAIEADIAQIQQVVMNLITNAAEAIGGEAPGMVTVSTGSQFCERAYLSQSRLPGGVSEGTYVYIEVADTGCGMEEETQSRMFEPFYTTKFTGRGLGLAATLGIVRGHRGAMILDSTPGEGTTFRVLFPAVDRLATAYNVPDTSLESGSNGGGTVLFVDDDARIRDVGRRLLERKGYRVITASDGREALDIFDHDRDIINGIILDLSMPGMGGEEAFMHLRDRDNMIPILISSGFSESEIVDRFAGAGLTGFIQKPYRAETFWSIVGDALRDRCAKPDRVNSDETDTPHE